MQKIDFEFTTEFGIYRDALYVPEDFSELQIENLKVARRDRWISEISLGRNLLTQFVASREGYREVIAAAQITPNDVFYDIGCGDGSILMHVYETYACKCVGVEIDPELAKIASSNTSAASNFVSIVVGDLTEIDVSKATVVYLYLNQNALSIVKDSLFSLQPGTKIISWEFAFEGIVPWKTIQTSSGTGYIWVVGETNG